jgi:soluble lytic murein transglycosylase
MLLDAPSEPNLLLDLNNWWTERRINCRGALNDGQPRTAFEIAAKHGLISGDGYIEAEFLAGWIALRFLGEPQTAMRHFTALRSAATSSKSIALGEYWLAAPRSRARGLGHGAFPRRPGPAYTGSSGASLVHSRIGRAPLPKRPIQASSRATPCGPASRASGLDGATPNSSRAVAQAPGPEVVLLVVCQASAGRRWRKRKILSAAISGRRLRSTRQRHRN